MKLLEDIMAAAKPHVDTGMFSPAATADELHKLESQLETLVTHHFAALKEEQALVDIQKLQQWIDACQEGSAIAERRLFQDGLILLESVKQKLALALQEEQRMTEESPAAATTAKGRTAERLAQASSQASEALSTLAHLTGEENAPDRPNPTAHK